MSFIYLYHDIINTLNTQPISTHQSLTNQPLNLPTDQIFPYGTCAASSGSSAPRPQPSSDAIGIRRGSRAYYALAGLPFVLLVGGTLYLGGSRMSRYKEQAHVYWRGVNYEWHWDKSFYTECLGMNIIWGGLQNSVNLPCHGIKSCCVFLYVMMF